jgi:hypothetical protein
MGLLGHGAASARALEGCKDSVPKVDELNRVGTKVRFRKILLNIMACFKF